MILSIKNTVFRYLFQLYTANQTVTTILQLIHFIMRKVALFALIVVCSGCFTPHQATVPQVKQTFTFDYTPKQTAKSGSVGMILALLKPHYATAFWESASNELFTGFQTALGNDIEELIVGKGFTMKGPFQAFDEMIFEDKKRTDIAIQIEISPQFTAAQGDWKSKLNFALVGGSYTTWTYTGKVSLIGKINLSGIEPLTHEKIWSKSVSIPNIEGIAIQTSNRYERPLHGSEIYQDPGVYNAVGKALNAQYGGIMDKVAAHFNAEEFITLKNQIKELKSKKGF